MQVTIHTDPPVVIAALSTLDLRCFYRISGVYQSGTNGLITDRNNSQNESSTSRKQID